MTQQFRMTNEIKGINDFGQIYSDQIYNATLTAATNTQLTVPGGGVMGALTSFGGTTNKNKVRAVIRTTGDVWVAVNQTADVPAAASFAKDTSELVTNALEKCYDLNVGDVLNFFSKTATTPSVSVAFYAMPS
jgi:O-acetyl-ADP-ribose deacetylase (regulator of RNase III)